MKFLLVAAILACASAFAPHALPTSARRVASVQRVSMEDMSWTGRVPPPKVMGPILSKTPSVILGPVAIAVLAFGLYSGNHAAANGAFSGETISFVDVIGACGIPLSWGLHVAAYIQKENGN